jgi:Protein of unknown function (DUF3106)
MKRRTQFGKWLLAAAGIALLALPCAAQKHDNKPPQQQRQRQPKAQRQERRQQQENRKGQNNRPNNDRPRNNVAPNREPQNRQPESMGMIGGNRLPNARGESGQPNFNRPPNANNRPSNPKNYRDLSPKEKQNYERFNRLPAQKQQEIRDNARAWGRLTPEQQSHIKNDVFPRWQQMSPDRQRAIRQRLGVLQNMPESARNQHLNDPNFTRGMSEEDKGMLRDLSHMHVGAPDPPGE